MFGGDEVYPFAKAGAYEAQTELPFAMGLEGGPDHLNPTLVAIPGNHDWLGGIEEFVTMFRSGRRFAGQWKTPQTENWWHVKLPQGWWLWGIDTGLDNELVGPQVEYFKEAAKLLEAGDRVILCTPVPLWQLRQKYRESYANLRSTFDPLITEHEATMPLCLSGDSHFFAHVERLDTDVDEDHITAGGGGAFLQPTHNLPERIPLEDGNAEFRVTTRWPLPADSRALAPGAKRIFDRQYWPLIAVGVILQLCVIGLGMITLFDPYTAEGSGWSDALSETVRTPWPWLLLLPLTYAGVIALRGNSVEPKLTKGARGYGLIIGAAVSATLLAVSALRRWLVDGSVGLDDALGLVWRHWSVASCRSGCSSPGCGGRTRGSRPLTRLPSHRLIRRGSSTSCGSGSIATAISPCTSSASTRSVTAGTTQ